MSVQHLDLVLDALVRSNDHIDAAKEGSLAGDTLAWKIYKRTIPLSHNPSPYLAFSLSIYLSPYLPILSISPSTSRPSYLSTQENSGTEGLGLEASMAVTKSSYHHR